VEVLHKTEELPKNIYLTSNPKCKPIGAKRTDAMNIEFNLIRRKALKKRKECLVSIRTNTSQLSHMSRCEFHTAPVLL
jgi:hypothetical protein